MLQSETNHTISDINPSILTIDKIKEHSLKEKLLDSNQLELNDSIDKATNTNMNAIAIDETEFSEKDNLNLSNQNIDNLHYSQKYVITTVQKEEEENDEEDILNQRYSFSSEAVEEEETEDNKKTIRESTISDQIARDSKIITESFVNQINSDSNVKTKIKADLVKEEKMTFIQSIFLFFKILLGIGLACSSSLILYYTYLDKKNFTGIKGFSAVVEPIIILISISGIFPKKSGNFRKIVSALYLWALLFLVPFSFLSKAYVETVRISILLKKILYARICLLIVQIFMHFIIVIFKMPF